MIPGPVDGGLEAFGVDDESNLKTPVEKEPVANNGVRELWVGFGPVDEIVLNLDLASVDGKSSSLGVSRSEPNSEGRNLRTPEVMAASMRRLWSERATARRVEMTTSDLGEQM